MDDQAASPTLLVVQNGGMKDSTGIPPRRAKQSIPLSKFKNFVRALPVLTVVLLVTLLYSVYIMLHAVPLLQVGTSPDLIDESKRTRGIIEIVIFHILFTLFVISYILSVITPPGSIPSSPEWDVPPEKLLLESAISISPSPAPSSSAKVRVNGIRTTPVFAVAEFTERKKSGGMRVCKWCQAVKPDRTHHCRVCRQCVLRMDHHCPWVHNCIGWQNHKYFVLLVFYTSLTLTFVIVTQLETIKSTIDEPTVSFGNVFLLLFSETLAAFAAFVSSSFFIFHVWLTCLNMSTIEFCEKKFRRGTDNELYNLGVCRNLRSAFGKNPFLWILPIDNREGDGVTFSTQTNRKRPDAESSVPLLLSSDVMENMVVGSEDNLRGNKDDVGKEV